ncbi:MAG: hypothetical protein ABWY06_16625 [Pseudomonas sp.]|uniref:hypothetical protein n=1 Tax=Pseudomonas sp. TaxID=306 RepID=UPI0033957BE0
MPYHQDREDHHGLSADRDDAAPDWLRQRQRPDATGRWLISLALLALLGAGLYQLAPRFGLEQWVARLTPGLTQPGREASAPLPIAPSGPSDPSPTPRPLDPNVPNQLTTASVPAERSLADCIGPGNVIDESVIHCRYGELPRSYSDTPTGGMVTPEYLARYKADQVTGGSARSGTAAEREVTAQWIRKWDGNGQFLAEWQSLDNRIDSTSVCANHRRGSIDYRECRKAAKVYFRERCRALEKRSSGDRDSDSKRMEHRYCSAANGFSPMG